MSEYKLVPIEPTRKMVTLGSCEAATCVKDDPCGEAGLHVWKTMLGAAPDMGNEYERLSRENEVLRTALVEITESGYSSPERLREIAILALTEKPK